MSSTQCQFPNIRAQSEHCFLVEVSQSSKISVLPMLMINFFDLSLNVWMSSVLFKSCRKNSLFGWFSNCWINFLTVSLRFVSCCWTVEWGTLGILLSTLPLRVPPELPNTRSEIQEVFGRVRVHTALETFLCSPPFVRIVIQALTGHCEVPSNFALNYSITSSNRTTPSSSRRIGGLCRSNLIMAFDTAKQYSGNLSGLMSTHFLSRIGMETRNIVTAVFRCSLAFATSFPLTLCSTLSTEMVSDVSVTNLLIPFTIRTQETVLNRDSIMTSIPWRPWRKQTFTSETGPIFVFPRIHPLTGDATSLRGNVYSRHRFFISSDEELSFFNNLQTGVAARCGQFLIFSKLFEFMLIILQQVSLQLIYRNNRTKNQFNGFFTTVEVNRLLTLLFAS